MMREASEIRFLLSRGLLYLANLDVVWEENEFISEAVKAGKTKITRFIQFLLHFSMAYKTTSH
jgi:hypothetical protein